MSYGTQTERNVTVVELEFESQHIDLRNQWSKKDMTTVFHQKGFISIKTDAGRILGHHRGTTTILSHGTYRDEGRMERQK